jgi:hypothetical protein
MGSEPDKVALSANREGSMANKLWLSVAFAAVLAIPAASLNAQNAQPNAHSRACRGEHRHGRR